MDTYMTIYIYAIQYAYTHIIKIIQCTIHVWTILKPLISILWPLVWLTSNLGADMANPYTGPSLICFGWLLLIVDRFFKVFLDQIWQIDRNLTGAAKLVTQQQRFIYFWHILARWKGSTWLNSPTISAVKNRGQKVDANISHLAVRNHPHSWGRSKRNRTTMDHQWHWQ